MDLRIAAYNVIVNDDRILLSRWSSGRIRTWTLPGGGVNLGEELEAAARRETWEETGYRIDVGELLGVQSRVIPGSRRLDAATTDALHQLRVVYRSTIVGGSLKNEVGGSTDRAEWFPLDGIPERRLAIVEFGLTQAGIFSPEVIDPSEPLHDEELDDA